MSSGAPTLPAWLLGEEAPRDGRGGPGTGATSACAIDSRPGGLTPSGRRRRPGAIERTITGISRALQSALFSERLAAREGLLQRMDPRLKLVSLLALLLTASLVRHPLTLAALYLLTLALAAASRLPTGFFLGRVWLFIPIFTGVVVIPSIFNVVRPGDPLLVLWDFGREVHLGPWSLGDTLAITRQGLYGAALLVLRVAVSVSLAVLLAVTTRWSELLKALRVFFVPRVFILILSMTYRYIHLLLGLATDMYMARRSRGGDGVRAAEERRFAAAGMGALLGKSRAMSDGIYSAMVSRGYDGEPLVLRRFTLSARDIWLGAGLIAAALLAAGGDRLLA